MLTADDALAAGLVDRIATFDETVARLSADVSSSTFTSLHARGTAQEPTATAQDRQRQQQQFAIHRALLDL
jgi:hypothetical protein